MTDRAEDPPPPDAETALARFREGAEFVLSQPDYDDGGRFWAAYFLALANGEATP